MTTAQDNATLIQTIVDAYNAKDLDPFTAAAADHVEVQDKTMGISHRGPAGYRQFTQDLHTAFPDGKIEVTNLHATDQQVILEFIGRGTHAGPIKHPTGHIPATGKRMEVHFCNIYEIRNGKIVSVRTYYDGHTLRQHLGL
jgi:steroid delta-isomerase-like uncharacterized protein